MNAQQRRLLARLAALREGTTMCPGQLARDCGTTLAQARADLMALARTKKIKLSQRGKSVHAGEIKGPFRISLRR
jgi:hypothetical protein